MKTRVLQLITDLDLGGAPLYVKDLALGLDLSRFEVQVACLSGMGVVAQELLERDVVVHCLSARGSWDIFRTMRRLKRVLKVYQPDILHCSLTHANVIGRIVGRKCEIPQIIATIHTAEQGKRWHLWAERLTWRKSDKIVCVSRSVLHHIHHHCKIPESHVTVINNGVDTIRFIQARPIDLAAEGLPHDRFTIIYTGRLDPVKNLPVLIEAINQVQTQCSVELQLLILGDGLQREELTRQIKHLQLEDTVKLIGPRRDVEQWLKAADIFVLPSQWEGFGLAAAEAMAAGLPVIASRTQGLQDIIEDGQNGLLVQPGRTEELAQAIITLINDTDLRNKLGISAQKTVLDNFTLNNMRENYQNLYLEMLK